MLFTLKVILDFEIFLFQFRSWTSFYQIFRRLYKNGQENLFEINVSNVEHFWSKELEKGQKSWKKKNPHFLNFFLFLVGQKYNTIFVKFSFFFWKIGSWRIWLFKKNGQFWKKNRNNFRNNNALFCFLSRIL